MNRYIIPVLGVLSVILLVAFWAYEKRSPNEAQSTYEVTAERKAACEQFLTVALFQEGGAADEFMKACLNGEPVLPSDVELDLPGREPIKDLNNTPYIGEGCAIGGCSNHLCGSVEEMRDVATTCEFQAEYACYPFARCEQQANGGCGWTETDEFNRCVADASIGAEVE